MGEKAKNAFAGKDRRCPICHRPYPELPKLPEIFQETIQRNQLMCGIAGIFGNDLLQDKKSHCRMINAMAHRGPDGKGIILFCQACMGYPPTGRAVRP